jgi:hypothetical protein
LRRRLSRPTDGSIAGVPAWLMAAFFSNSRRLVQTLEYDQAISHTDVVVGVQTLCHHLLAGSAVRARELNVNR